MDLATYYATKDRVMAALAQIGATTRESAATERDLVAAGGEALAADAYMVASRGAEVKYSRADGYWLGRVRNNGRS
ncbi:hypothetical protein SEA_LEMOND_100 [Mycobacterium phage LeMond]|uniref:Uncharacterized protein n=1 Tax=Mycobacterium phage KiSi TaxID=2507856 RepID=A0A410TBS3_9CAUD|nr:hypothetical protein I5G98_gp007 [Mycobacterium phage KiSi]AYR01165.1 hypothetical protein SEA_LEMOND_100 [Mycobacterium phage LeMond]AYR01268.1 hypothetical protein SEA_OSCAR_101 [Mycobacterium phage Oscar]AYR01700.1 hypothetical protein SEA_SCARLETT_100 [Mycobacterium phage Scarlett]QAU06519.1 hypothetical protein SEA_KISI_101 [Mycobacterium phage KiSi]